MLADGRRQFEYDVAIDQMCMLTQIFVGKFDPYVCNPYRQQAMPGEPKPGDTPESREIEANRGWKLLGVGLRMMAGRH